MFRNEIEDVNNVLKKLLMRTRQWAEVKDITEAGEYDAYVRKYFDDIIDLINEVVSVTEMMPKNTDKLGLVLIVKNEERYLPEWIEFHKIVGASRFFIYDNGSTDGTKSILQQYIDEGSVEYTWCPGKKRQLPAYMDALDRFRFEVKYMGFIDTDEFILPLEGDSITDCVDKIIGKYQDASGIVISWRMFGSDGEISDNGKPVIGTFLHRAENSFWQHQHVKTICDPRKALFPMNPHAFIYLDDGYAVNERGEKFDGLYDFTGQDQDCRLLQINHYYVKSREYWIKEKMKRGFADLDGNYRDHLFDMNDRNEIEDKRMLKYSTIVEENLRKRGLLHE